MIIGDLVIRTQLMPSWLLLHQDKYCLMCLCFLKDESCFIQSKVIEIVSCYQQRDSFIFYPRT